MTTQFYRSYGAPWGKLLWGLSTLGTTAIGGACIAGAAASAPLAAICAGTLGLCAAGAIRGYRIEDQTLIVERVGSDKRIDLSELKNVRFDKTLLHKSIRVGNGGLFAFTGWYRTSKLGWFRLYGTDILGCPVLLDFGSHRLVVTPENPEQFVRDLKQVSAC
jgi:hypothetical protein